MIELELKTYTAVKRSLQLIAAVLFVMAALAFYFGVLPSDHQDRLSTAWGVIKDSNLVSGALVSAIGLMFGFVFAVLFEFHDKFYDKYVIKWRQDYDKDIIIPRLIAPLYHALDPLFLREIERDPRIMMRVFYRFVGDYGGESII